MVAQQQRNMVVMIRRVLDLEKNLNEWEECTVAGVEIVEVFPSEELDLVNTGLQFGPFVQINSNTFSQRQFHVGIDHPQLDSAVIIGFPHCKWQWSISDIVGRNVTFRGYKGRNVVYGASDIGSRLSETCVQDVASDGINGHCVLLMEVSPCR